MSKRARVPAPLPRLPASVVRTLWPKLIIAATGFGALLIFGGGSYLLAHIDKPNTAAQPLQTTKATMVTDAQALPAQTVTQTNAAPSQTTPLSTAKSVAQPVTAPQPLPDATRTVPTPSLHIAIAASNVTRGTTGLVNIPFTVTSDDLLSQPIDLLPVAVLAGGNRTNLIQVQSARMTGANNGIITLLPVGPFPHYITITISARSGIATGSLQYAYYMR